MYLIDPYASASTVKLKNDWNYRVIHKSLRDFRTRLRNNQDRRGRKEHIMGPWARTACSFRSAQEATLLELMYHSRIVLSVGGSV